MSVDYEVEGCLDRVEGCVVRKRMRMKRDDQDDAGKVGDDVVDVLDKDVKDKKDVNLVVSNCSEGVDSMIAGIAVHEIDVDDDDPLFPPRDPRRPNPRQLPQRLLHLVTFYCYYAPVLVLLLLLPLGLLPI